MRGMEDRLGARIDDVEARLGARIDNVEARINGLEEHAMIRYAASCFPPSQQVPEPLTSDSHQNAVARLQNGFVANTRESPLEPLQSVLTGNPIPNFPLTVDDIDHLTGPQADAILRELGGTAQGGVREKRKRIRAHCGIRPAV